MTDNNAIVWIFDSHTGAEAGIKELQSHHFDRKKLSIVGKDYQTEEHVVGFHSVEPIPGVLVTADAAKGTS